MTGPPTLSFDAKGGELTVAFSANRAWKVSAADSWVRINPQEGLTHAYSASGPHTVTVEKVQGNSVTRAGGGHNGLFVLDGCDVVVVV